MASPVADDARWRLLAILTTSYGAGAFGMLGISPLSPSLVATRTLPLPHIRMLGRAPWLLASALARGSGGGLGGALPGAVASAGERRAARPQLVAPSKARGGAPTRMAPGAHPP